VLGKYVKRTMRQVAKGIRKRHADRTKGRQEIQNEATASIQNGYVEYR
jgi:hypothetical protein